MRPGRDFSPTYSCLTGMISVLCPGGATVSVVDPRPIVACGGVPNLDVQLQRIVGLDMQVGLQVVVARPVLRSIHDHVRSVDTQGLLPVRGVPLDHLAAAERILVLERRDQLHRRAADHRLLDLQHRTAGVALLPGGHVPVRALRTADGVGGQFTGRRDRRLFRPQDGLVRQRHVVADLDQRHVVDPEVAGGKHAERRPGLFLLLDVRHVRQLRPAERAVLLQLHVLAVEHELGRRVPDAGADIQIRGDRP